MMTTRGPRPGVSLLEVLVAIFVMAIGLLALLTLFPLGALRMGQALKDDRTAQLAQTADVTLRAHWRGSVVRQETDGNFATLPDAAFLAMDDPHLFEQRNSVTNPGTYESFYPTLYRLLPPGVMIPQTGSPPANITLTSIVRHTRPGVTDNPTIADLTNPPAKGHYVNHAITPIPAPSYPVMIDPLGFFARSASSADWLWVGNTPGNTALRIPRRNFGTVYPTPQPSPPTNTNPPVPRPSITPSGIAAIQTCCLTGDFTFQANGTAGDTANPGGLTRQGRYSWAAILQRQDNAVRGVATLQIMVFDGRPPLLATPGDEVVINLPPLAFVPGQRTVSLSVPSRGADQVPLIRKGGWILDGTIDIFNGPVRNANFYRIVGVTEGGPDPANPSNTLFALDLETEIQGPVSPAGTSIYLFAGLAEVFRRAPLEPEPTQ